MLCSAARAGRGLNGVDPKARRTRVVRSAEPVRGWRGGRRGRRSRADEDRGDGRSAPRNGGLFRLFLSIAELGIRDNVEDPWNEGYRQERKDRKHQGRGSGPGVIPFHRSPVGKSVDENRHRIPTTPSPRRIPPRNGTKKTTRAITKSTTTSMASRISPMRMSVSAVSADWLKGDLGCMCPTPRGPC